MTVKLLTEHNMEFLSSKGGCTNSSESIKVKWTHFWKSHVTDIGGADGATYLFKECVIVKIIFSYFLSKDL